MTDAELRKKARRVTRLEQRITDLNKEMRDLKDELVAEMRDRGDHVIEGGGIRVTYVSPEIVTYDEARLRRLLHRRGADDVWESCLEPRFSKERMAAAVQEGLLPMALVDKVSDVTPGTAYVRVTGVASR